MTAKIVLADADAAIVRSILQRHLPATTRVFVFGSRATGQRVKPWSDLHLALEGNDPVSWSNLAHLADEFDESDLPWKVDLVDCAAISPEFRRIVDATKLPFDLAPPTD